MSDDRQDIDRENTHQNSNTQPSGGEEPLRGKITLPEKVEFPRLLDFYDLQDAQHTQIHRFYENLQDGRLTTTECTKCGELHYPPRIVCPKCLSSNLTYVDLPHRGKMHSFTEVRGTSAIGMDDDTPFVVGVVDLGQVKLSARVDDASYDDLEIGSQVRLKVIDIDDNTDQNRVFYRFVPV